MTCEKCGHEIKEGNIVCGYCGKAIPIENISQSTSDEKQSNSQTHNPSTGNIGSLFMLGRLLMYLGIVTDVIAMILIATGNYDFFTPTIIGGTICSVVGFFFHQ